MNERGCRTFDVPTDSLLEPLRDRLRASTNVDSALAAAIAGADFQVRLLGEQKPGTTIAAFTLAVGFADAAQGTAAGDALSRALASWWTEHGPAVARDLLSPFGFSPGSPQGGRGA